MALLVLLNLLLVLFDYSYLNLRDFYLSHLPSLTRFYDPMKAIEPHRETQQYLETVDRLQVVLAQTGPLGPQVNPLLRQLQQQSISMIEENPFQIANKTGTLEKIKNRMRRHLDQESAKAAFQEFWSAPYLVQHSWPQELTFFNQEIRPLIATNYYRPLGETGEFVDNFWRIDLIFMGIFALEFLGRTYYLSRRHRGYRWLDTMLWRWYDLFLLLPFWRLLRVIPTTVRLHQAGWLNLQRVRFLINRNLAENIAGEMTELVLVRTIDLVQGALERGAIRRWLTRPQLQRVEVNQINEIAAIAEHLVQLTVYRVLPQIQPDLEALLRHAIEAALLQIPLYQGLQKLPGMEKLPQDMATQVARQVSERAYTTLTHSLEDAKGAAMVNQLSQHFLAVLRQELQEKQTVEEIQLLLIDLLEELKLTLIQRAATDNVERTLSEMETLRQKTYETLKLSAAAETVKPAQLNPVQKLP